MKFTKLVKAEEKIDAEKERMSEAFIRIIYHEGETIHNIMKNIIDDWYKHNISQQDLSKLAKAMSEFVDKYKNNY